MTTVTLDFAVDNGIMQFRTPTGFHLTSGRCALTTTRGESRPTDCERLGVRHDLCVRRLSGAAVEFRQTVRNLGREDLKIEEVCAFSGRLDLEGAGWRAAHVELFKRDRYFEGYNAYTGGLFAPLPGLEAELGLSEDLPFPGLFITHPERGTVLMAVLSQDRCKPVWRLHRRGAATELCALDHFSGVPHLLVRPGAELSTERWVLLWTAGGVEEAVEKYYALLRRKMTFRGEDSVLRRAVVWGSWNYNYRPRGHMDITHDYLAANARALTELVPERPRFVMIDDGYQRGSSTGGTKGWFASCLEIFHADGAPPHDPALFPRGMQAVAGDIVRAGVVPAIWTTPRLHRESSLARERPEWLLALSGGRDFGPRSAYLDYSIPEVREYTRAAWRTILRDWGYRAVKLDFWTIPFEVPFVRFRNRDRTAIELRNLFLSDLREIVPDGGYILTGVAVNGGNPFVGRYVDAARCAQDIGDGLWSLVRESASYLSVVPAFYRHDGLLADADSVGWCPRMTPSENRLWATMALMTGGMCEIGGDLTTLAPEGRALLRKVVTTFAPARRTRYDFEAAGLCGVPAQRMVLERDDGVWEAHFNWMEYARETRQPPGARDLWSGKKLGACQVIPPHDVVWFRH